MVVTSVSYSMTADDFGVDGTGGGGGITATLYDAPEVGKIVSVSKADAGAGAVTVDGGTYNINGSGTYALASQYDSAIFQFNGTEWRIIATK